MTDILFLKLDKNIKVKSTSITVGNACKVECADKHILSKVKIVKIMNIEDKKNNRYVISVMKIIEKIHEEYPTLEIVPLGETDFIVEYDDGKKKPEIYKNIKAIFVSLIIFFGAGFTIMAFNNDVAVKDVFDKIYEAVMGHESEGITAIEVMYSVGLAFGIIVFYNHFGKKKITKDPTPIEVEMRQYEEDINTTLIDGVNREDAHIDVD